MKNVSLNKKLYFLTTVFLLGSILVAVLGIRTMSRISVMFSSVLDGDVQKFMELREVERSIHRVQLWQEKAMVETKDKRGALVIAIGKELDKISTTADDLLKVSGSDEKAQLTNLKGVIASWQAKFQGVSQAIKAGDMQTASSMIDSNAGSVVKLAESMDQLFSLSQKSIARQGEDATVSSKSTRDGIIWISVLVSLASWILATLIIRSVVLPIDHVIRQMTQNSSQLTNVSSQIARSSIQLSEASTEQAASLEETASALEELNSMVRSNSDASKEAFEISDESLASATRGKTVVGDMIRSIDKISDGTLKIMGEINESNTKIGEIVKVISDISEKTKVINDIVFQTKLLSFNASVEAARAGEHGKGFAVVAEEVGNLAQMSGNASREIAALLEESVRKVQSIVDDTNQKVQQSAAEGKTSVDQGIQMAKACGEVLDEIVGHVSKTHEMASQIAAASKEQAQGIEEISKNVSQIDHVVQQNASVSEEQAASAEQLSSQAKNLAQVVQELVGTVRGSGGRVSMVVDTSPSNSAPAGVSEREREHSNVIPLQKAKKTAPATHAPTPAGDSVAATGFDGVPAEDDVRFKEI